MPPVHEDHIHSVAEANEGRLKLVFLLTAGFLAVEVAAAWVTGSLALLADAGHMLADVAAVAMALTAIRFGRRPADPARTYGYYRLEMLAALANGVLLLAMSGYLVFEAYRRFSDPPRFDGWVVLGVAIAGLLVNVAGAGMLAQAQKTSLNLRGAYLEVLSDLLGSVVVIVAAIVFLATGFGLIDVIASLFIGLFIVPRALSLTGQAVHVLLEGVPRDVDITDVRRHILETPGVESVHDLHVWNLTSGMNVMSAHVVIQAGTSSEEILDALQGCLGDHFDIAHSTIQIESADRSAQERAGH